MSWLEPQHRTILNYQQADSLWSKVRSPAKGKPVTGWLRMFKEGNDFLFKMTGYGSVDLCRLSPDNRLSFVAPAESVYGQAQTLVSSLHRWLPFTMMRHRKGLYRIGHTKQVIAECAKKHEANKAGENDPYYGHIYAHYRQYTPTMREMPSYFQGIEFDIVDGTCLNPRPDDKLVEKPEERKEWRRALAKFKRGIKARVRVHAFDGIIDEMWSERDHTNRWDWRQPQWESKQWLDLLEHGIRHNEFPQELLKGLAQTTSTGYYMSNKPEGKDVLKALDYVCNNNSIELRRRFDVFESEK
jgi:hypothetical protein